MSCAHTLYPRLVNDVGCPTLPGPSHRTLALRGLDGHLSAPQGCVCISYNHRFTKARASLD